MSRRSSRYYEKAIVPEQVFAAYPTYGEEYFSKDIILTSQPIVGEPSVELLHEYRYIIFRVGPEYAVHHVNSEKLWNKSPTFGQDLLSRLTKIPAHLKYRLDLPYEEEEPFVNFIEWINNNSYTFYKDTFRGCFIRHLKLYNLAVKYGVEELRQYTLNVVIDMLIEGHPEQMTRTPFWNVVVKLIYDGTRHGDEMREMILVFPLWYARDGRARLYETKSSTVRDTLLALGSIPSTSPLYRVDSKLRYENLEYFEETIREYFGNHVADAQRTRWWKDSVEEDSLFQVWLAHWKMVGGQEQPAQDKYVDMEEMVEEVDEEDEIRYVSDETKEFESKSEGMKGGSKIGGGKRKSRAKTMKEPKVMKEKEGKTVKAAKRPKISKPKVLGTKENGCERHNPNEPPIIGPNGQGSSALTGIDIKIPTKHKRKHPEAMEPNVPKRIKISFDPKKHLGPPAAGKEDILVHTKTTGVVAAAATAVIVFKIKHRAVVIVDGPRSMPRIRIRFDPKKHIDPSQDDNVVVLPSPSQSVKNTGKKRKRALEDGEGGGEVKRVC